MKLSDKKKEKIARLSDPNVMVLYVRRRVNVGYPLSIFEMPMRGDSTRALRDLGPIGAKLVQAIAALPGVVQVAVEPYRLIIEKVPGVAWEKRGFGDGIVSIVHKHASVLSSKVRGETFSVLVRAPIINLVA